MALKLTTKKGSPYFYVRGTVAGMEIEESTKIPLAERRRAEKYRIEREMGLLI